MLEPAQRAARAGEHVGKIAETIWIGLDAGGNVFARVGAPNHYSGHVTSSGFLLLGDARDSECAVELVCSVGAVAVRLRLHGGGGIGSPGYLGTAVRRRWAQ